jgi:methylglutaconyl-CoA hydratase
MLSARRVGAEEARDLGLLAQVVGSQELDAAVEAEVAALLDCAPGAVAEAKAMIRRLRPPAPGALEASVAALVARWETEEARDGVRAFFDRREPPWRG